MNGMRKTALVATIPALLFAGMSDAGAPEKRVQRKLAVVEKIFDATMIDSPYALVTGGDNTRGVYLADCCALFTLQFSFVEGERQLKIDHLGDVEKFVKQFKERLERDDEEQEAVRAKRRELLDNIKEELIQAVVDYGPTLTFLTPGESVVVAAFPWGEEWDVTPAPVRDLQITIPAGKLMEHAQGSISDEQLAAAVVISESPR